MMSFRGWWMPAALAVMLPAALAAQEDDCPCRERPGMIGVLFQADSTDDGVRVVEVRRGSAAERAGVREGEVVVQWNGSEPRRALRARPGQLQAGDTVRLRVRGDGGEREVVVVADARTGAEFQVIRPELMERLRVLQGDSLRFPLQALTIRIDSLHTRLMEMDPASIQVQIDTLVRVFGDSAGAWRMLEHDLRASLQPLVDAEVIVERDARPFFMELGRRSAAGAELAEMNEGLSAYFGGRREGALVIEVSPESPAARAGLLPGDVIVQAAGQAVEGPADVRAALNRAQSGQVALEVIRRGERRELSLEWTGPRSMGPEERALRRAAPRATPRPRREVQPRAPRPMER